MINRDAQKQLVARLAKIEGQVRGLVRMIEEPRLCVEIITQIAAAQAALKRVGDIIMDCHLNGCILESMTPEDLQEHKERIIELREIFSQYCKLPAR